MTSDIELERPVRPSDTRRHRGLHSRRRRFGDVTEAIIAAINALFA